MRNRWFIALAAIGLHISIGSVYAWSVLTRPIMADMGFTLSQTTWTFSLAILMLGLSAGFLGSFAEKIGPKKSGLLAMLFWVTGLLGTAYALSIHNLTLLYLFYGIIGGIGLGIGYITPVSTLVKYFPNRPGFATGLAIMGFGFASLIAGPLMQFLVAQFGLVNNFIILGVIYLVIMGASSLYLKAPQQKHSTRTTKDKSTMYVHTHGMLANDAMKTWQFGALWWVFFINITCGYRSTILSITYGARSHWYDTYSSCITGWYHRYLQWRGSHCMVYDLRLPWTSKNLHTFLYYRNRRILFTRPNQ